MYEVYIKKFSNIKYEKCNTKFELGIRTFIIITRSY